MEVFRWVGLCYGARMPATRRVLIFLLGVFAGGALLAPWVHGMMQWAAGHFPILEGVADEPFRRYVSRMWMILGGLSVYPLIRSLGLPGWRSLGLGPWRQGRNLVGRGIFWGWISLALIAAMALGFGARTWVADRSALDWGKHLFNATLAAILVGTLEELFFRGALLTALRRELGFRGAALATGALYAILHFLDRPPEPEVIHWWTGLSTMAGMAAGFTQWEILIPGFFNLFLAGWILAWVREESVSLYPAIGLHAGWIFWLKTYGWLSTEAPGASVWVWGTRKLVDGWFCLAMLLLLWGGLSLLHPFRVAGKENEPPQDMDPSDGPGRARPGLS